MKKLKRLWRIRGCTLDASNTVSEKRLILAQIAEEVVDRVIWSEQLGSAKKGRASVVGAVVFDDVPLCPQL